MQEPTFDLSLSLIIMLGIASFGPLTLTGFEVRAEEPGATK